MSSILDALRKSELERQKATGQGPNLPYPVAVKHESKTHPIPVLFKIAVASCIGLAIWWAGFTMKDSKPTAIPPVAASPTESQPGPVVNNTEAKSLPKPLERDDTNIDDTRSKRTAKIPQQQPTTSPVTPTPIAAVPAKPALDPLEGLPPLEVAGFMRNGQGGNIAIINDRLMKEGDEVSPGLRVEKIKDDSVIFSYKGYVFSR